MCVATVAAFALSWAPVAVPAVAAPLPADRPDRPVSELLAELRSRYQEAGAATEAYNAAHEKLKSQRTEVTKLTRQLSDARARLDAERADAARLAGQQYRGSTAGLTPYLRLLLSRDPHKALSHGHLLRRIAHDRAVTVRKLTGGERRLDRTISRARRALDRQHRLAEEQRDKRDTVRERLDEVTKLLASLSEDQLARLRQLEQRQADSSQRKFLATGLLSLRDVRAPSARGERAVKYALEQLGKPYMWGAQGPDSFDCSGLTSQAWASADQVIPRTSQEQWRQLPRVPLGKLRPGDLVVYFKDATHVAMYIGDGKVVQAPRPGAKVKVSPVAANPVLGAVRPDGGAQPLRDYTPPEIPADAADGDDTGYGSADAPREG
ncbi:NlpC/P60 family protein [Streptomyces gobiensis]|uniref:C40 family peptidase n=1 Tax=Streptomyces gobiensis TaxID=2875706 RepID=UPI001E2EAB2F|nr:NlpC/P60 family protein [Streptomyces gobiensis]UGY93617.1 NlpC/P60 family protein [Streptomyces gobiensis]